MEILKILEESADNLISEDLDFFETELATGSGYSKDYKQKCHSKIKKIRQWMASNKPENEQTSAEVLKGKDAHKKGSNGIEGVEKELESLVPCSDKSQSLKFTPVQIVQTDLKSIRSKNDYKNAFKSYVKDSKIIDSEFIDKNYAIFDIWEINTILSVKQLGDDFLEKYFGALDHEKIARYQLFSENFFMKHFTQLDSSIVLEHGKNEWRKKENRSKQLDVFLRLKGVKI